MNCQYRWSASPEPAPLNTAEFGGIYAADTYCTDCIAAIRARLDAEGKRPADPSDEYGYDSDDYPKEGGSWGESDTPCHCGSRDDCPHAQDSVPPILTCKHANGLTCDGVRYVIDYLDEATSRTACLDQWAQLLEDYDGSDVRAALRRYWRLGLTAEQLAAIDDD